jgi:hypothetical protein
MLAAPITPGCADYRIRGPVDSGWNLPALQELVVAVEGQAAVTPVQCHRLTPSYVRVSHEKQT